MPLKGPTPADVAKLNSEINQFGNQRFVLTTLAITSFGVLTAWMIPKDDANIGDFPFAISIISSILLFAIYFWSYRLRHSESLLARYLVETQQSGWESDLREFHKEGFFSQSKQQTVMFLLLIMISNAFPFMLRLLASSKPTSSLWTVSVALSLFLSLLICLMGFSPKFDGESSIGKRWRELNIGSEAE